VVNCSIGGFPLITQISMDHRRVCSAERVAGGDGESKNKFVD
jgi:hypothetical protein